MHNSKQLVGRKWLKFFEATKFFEVTKFFPTKINPDLSFPDKIPSFASHLKSNWCCFQNFDKLILFCFFFSLANNPTLWEPSDGDKENSQPILYKGFLDIDGTPKDTFLKTRVSDSSIINLLGTFEFIFPVFWQWKFIMSQFTDSQSRFVVDKKAFPKQYWLAWNIFHQIETNSETRKQFDEKVASGLTSMTKRRRIQISF